MPTGRTQRTARRLDRAKALEQANRGLSNPEIAKQQGVAPSTVFRFMQRQGPERHAVKQFRAGRADVLARLQVKSLDAQERILETLNDAVIGALTPSQKTGLLMALNAQHGTLFDKERLETGQSTQNHAVLAKLMAEALQQVGKSKHDKDEADEKLNQ
jgi:IS30 family transposase